MKKKLSIQEIKVSSFVTNQTPSAHQKGGLRPDSEPWCTDYPSFCIDSGCMTCVSC